MKRVMEERKKLIYDLMNGTLEFKDNPPEECKYVEDEFLEGKVCEQAYTEIMNAYHRLCERLGMDGKEDEDIEIIIDKYEVITETLCMKMFDYGVLFSGLLDK
ncbi:hypothetical protein LI031_00100 [Enterocloster citroniae]|nr:hypothetical protein [Enterocloster citroniae]